MTKTKAVLFSIIWALIILIFPITSGIIATIFEFNTEQTFLLQGAFMLLSIPIPVIYIKLKKCGFNEFGFRKISNGSARKALFFIPLLLIILPFVVLGIDIQSIKYFFALLFFALAVGISEEIYFRGVIQKLLTNAFASKIAVILLSALIFGMGHSASIVGTGDIFSTFLQVVNAFFFGIVAAEIVCITKSLYPAIIFHFLYNLSNYITTVSGTTETVCIIIRVVITLVTGIFYFITINKEIKTNTIVKGEYE